MTIEQSWQQLLRSNPIKLRGPELHENDEAPDFCVINSDFEPVRLSDARGLSVIIASVFSVDTPVCDTFIRRLDSMLHRGNTEIWAISMDLPFVQKRWREAVGVQRVKTLSDFRDRSFAQNYGLIIEDGPFAGISARAVFVVTPKGTLNYVCYLKHLSDEPDYDSMLRA